MTQNKTEIENVPILIDNNHSKIGFQREIFFADFDRSSHWTINTNITFEEDNEFSDRAGIYRTRLTPCVFSKTDDENTLFLEYSKSETHIFAISYMFGEDIKTSKFFKSNFYPNYSTRWQEEIGEKGNIDDHELYGISKYGLPISLQPKELPNGQFETIQLWRGVADEMRPLSHDGAHVEANNIYSTMKDDLCKRINASKMGYSLMMDL